MALAVYANASEPTEEKTASGIVITTMKVGGKVNLVCPSKLAYGSSGVAGTIPHNATPVLDVKLLEIVT